MRPSETWEAIGLLCDVTLEDGRQRTQNVEYNEYEPLSKKLGGEGDVPERLADGSRGTHSPFPGSINTLVLRLDTYLEVVSKTHGVVPEFINPKFVSGSTTQFRSPARIESLMQDIALMMDAPHHRVGGTVFEEGLYHPLKNSFEEGLKKAASGVDAHTACTAEAAIYTTHRNRLLTVLSTLTSLDVSAPLSTDEHRVVIPSNPPLHLPFFPVVVLDAAVQSGSSLNALQSHLHQWFPVHVNRIQLKPHCALFVKGATQQSDRVQEGSKSITARRREGSTGAASLLCD